MRVVVIGGFGNFGARICRQLREEPRFEVIATRRHVQESFDGAAVRTARLDINSTAFASALRALAADVVVHCAGPFQGQGYRVAEAALACGAHYIDLADGRDFVTRFAAHNQAAARAADRVALSGASTLPALSSAVIDHLQQRFAQIEEIEIAIAPGQHTPRGTATMAAVLGYAGKGFPWWQDGTWQIAYGWQELKRIQFPFGMRWAAACDVPDLALFPARYPGVRTVTFRAALEVPLQHYALWSVASLRRMGVPGLRLERWAKSLDRAAAWLDRFGSDCSGMSVSVTGRAAAGGRRRAIWQLVAKDNHGPEIPCMAAILLVRKLAAGVAVPRAAQACMGLLTLAEFEPEFARWSISTTIEESAA